MRFVIPLCGVSLVGVDRPARPRERLAAAAGPRRDDLGQHRYRRLLRGPRAEVEPARRVQAP
jgi:hypothetical protein